MNIPLNIDWQQILLHLLNFVILAGGLYLLLYKPVKTFMEKRQLYYQEQGYVVNGGRIGELSQKLYDELTGIQWGKRDDPFGWTYRV